MQLRVNFLKGRIPVIVEQIREHMIRVDGRRCNDLFKKEVDVEKHHNYLNYVQHPMDLTTIRYSCLSRMLPNSYNQYPETTPNPKS